MIPTAEAIGDPLVRNNVRVLGNPNGRPIVFSHGFGCSQEVWRHMVPFFERDYRVVLFDHVGAGGSNLAAYDHGKYDSLDGYAQDVLEIIDALGLTQAVFVGHSVSAMVGILAANRDSSRFGALVLVGPSARYVDDAEYRGGFARADIDSLLDTLDSNYLGWSATIAPLMMGNSDRPELGRELTENFCTTDPTIARHFARVTFLSDNRRDLARVSVPTLVLQSREDVIAPAPVGRYVHEQISGSQLVMLTSSGHCPNLSDPAQLARRILDFIG
ncbi:alpha/beta hydrolase [Glaciihabitans sp. INWT7]|uniref:alpha/beta fold hydrolase n=1 Tax=Glaciihabitans sp. INWT7 TaxID=2596912 RepID=UPI001626DC4C|nr:alpha/beta hydrolase [Glaciihabitans sp. INWT7]QNE47839.1 alpha/beta hydrolase [Glaciihabitans sp. INWT7]